MERVKGNGGGWKLQLSCFKHLILFAELLHFSVALKLVLTLPFVRFPVYPRSARSLIEYSMNVFLLRGPGIRSTNTKRLWYGSTSKGRWQDWV